MLHHGMRIRLRSRRGVYYDVRARLSPSGVLVTSCDLAKAALEPEDSFVGVEYVGGGDWWVDDVYVHRYRCDY